MCSSVSHDLDLTRNMVPIVVTDRRCALLCIVAGPTDPKLSPPAYMAGMTNNYNPDQKRGGAANAGNWTKYENSDPEAPIEAVEAAEPILPETPEPLGGHSYTVTESPVGDRDRNYHLTFDKDGGYISVNPLEFGIEDPEYRTSNEHDELYVGSENDRNADYLQVQYVNQSNAMFGIREYIDELDDIPEETMAVVEKEILDELQGLFGEDIDIQFSSGGDRWDDLQIMFNTKFPAARQDDGRLTATTSNIMFALEEDPKYQSIRTGAAEATIYQALHAHDIAFH